MLILFIDSYFLCGMFLSIHLPACSFEYDLGILLAICVFVHLTVAFSEEVSADLQVRHF